MDRFVLASSLVALTAVSASARPLVDTRVDTTPGNTIGTYNYTGAGNGFGGRLGSATMSMDSDGANLYISLTPGALDNNVAILLDSRAGGFRDADMRDRGDGGRRAVSELSLETDDAFDVNFLPDFGLVMGGFGGVMFELNAGNTDFHLPFVSFDAGGQLTYTIPLATLGVAPGGNVDFFAVLISDSGYLSNESIPAYDPLQLNGNPGFGDGQFGGTVGSPGMGNYDRFTVVPTPGALALGLVGAVAAIRRRRA